MRSKLIYPVLILILAMAAVLPVTALAADNETAPEPVLSQDGASFTYKGETTVLGPHSLYLDAGLTDAQTGASDYLFNSFNEMLAAANQITDGTAEDPVNVYIAPDVYWIHDPDAEKATDMYSSDQQLLIDCPYLHLYGLSDDMRDIVIASNFGHDQGLDGVNYTMFYLASDGFAAEDLTFGNYCNVDLVYPRDPSKNRPMRTQGNITQGQIAWSTADRMYFENVGFISRLNMMPFLCQSGRALYVDCHLESTDDAMNYSSGAVYLRCDFDFYSSKPWGNAYGVTLLDCTMNIVHPTADLDGTLTQYMAKGFGPFAVIDSKFVSDYPGVTVNIGWSDVFDDTFRSYYSNVTHNGQPVTFDYGGSTNDASVDLTGTDALRAFKLTDADGNVIYNVYNLLRGEDDWDPLGQKEQILALDAADLPTYMNAYVSDTTAAAATIESGNPDDVLTLVYELTGPQATDYSAKSSVTWSVAPGDEKYVSLKPSADGRTCTVEGINTTEETVKVIVTARDASGFEAAVELTVRPSVLPSPVFETLPEIVLNDDGTATVEYSYTAQSMGGRADNSRITWYVSSDPNGVVLIPVAVGRSDTPLTTIPVLPAYDGRYLVAVVEPKHIRSEFGQPGKAVSRKLGGPSAELEVDLASFPTATQKSVIPGFWTVDSYKPADTDVETGAFKGGWSAACDGTSKWAYGTGEKNGFKDVTGLYMTDRGARLMYTPLSSGSGDMSFTVTLAPGKTAGQGFGSANQYLDVMVKYDAVARTGYGLRIYRDTGSSCAFVLISHKDGESALLGEPVSSGVLLTTATVRVWTENGTLNAEVTSSDAKAEEMSISLTAKVPGITSGADSGVCLQHTGTAGDNAMFITSMHIAWSEGQESPYDDVASGDDCYEAVKLLSDYRYINGVGERKFAPDTDISRAAFVSILYRISGETATTASTFTDLTQGWYSDAVAWAQEKGLVNGMAEGKFDPDTPINRADAVTILYRYAAYKGADVSASSDLSVYTDAGELASWTVDQYKWALSVGIVAPATATTLAPSSGFTRADAAVILYNLLVFLAK